MVPVGSGNRTRIAELVGGRSPSVLAGPGCILALWKVHLNKMYVIQFLLSLTFYGLALSKLHQALLVS